MEVQPKRILFGPKAFDCDILFKQDTTQDSLFDNCCRPIVDAVLDGAKGTIMVYGQTGTGKTHTMFGPPTEEPNGVVFQSVERILSSIMGQSAVLSLSVLEVYMENVTDLLTMGGVKIHCGNARDLKWVPISSVTEASKTVHAALAARHVAATQMNERSSRSHVIVQLKIVRKTSEENENTNTESATLSLVDLAGSECVGKSKVAGKAMQEASSINKSLLALKQIILALSGSSTPTHVPYRDSKLTELLQDSIGGCSKTLLIACVSPAARDQEETKSTLEYSTKARSIKNIAATDSERMKIKVRSMEAEIQKLKNKLELQASEKGQVVLSKQDHDELTARASKFDEMSEELQSMIAANEKFENNTLYQNGIEKALRDDLERQQAKIDSHVASRMSMTSSVVEAVREMTSHMEQYMVNTLHRNNTSINTMITSMHAKEVPSDATQMFEDCMRRAMDDVKAFHAEIIQQVVSRTKDITARLDARQAVLAANATKLRKLQDDTRNLLLNTEHLAGEIGSLSQDTGAVAELGLLADYVVGTGTRSALTDAPLRTATTALTDAYRHEMSSATLDIASGDMKTTVSAELMAIGREGIRRVTELTAYSGLSTIADKRPSDGSATGTDPKRRKKSVLGAAPTNVTPMA